MGSCYKVSQTHSMCFLHNCLTYILVMDRWRSNGKIAEVCINIVVVVTCENCSVQGVVSKMTSISYVGNKDVIDFIKAFEGNWSTKGDEKIHKNSKNKKA